MKYEKLKQRGFGIPWEDSYVQFLNLNGKTILFLRKKYDFSLICQEEINTELYLSRIINSKAILTHFQLKGYYEFDLVERKFEYFETNLIPVNNCLSQTKVYLDQNERIYKFKNGEKLIYSFKTIPPNSNKIIQAGIIHYYIIAKENNWIKFFDPIKNIEIWRLDFPWRIVRLEEYDNLIVIQYHTYDYRKSKGYENQRDWYNPNCFTIVIDALTGKEKWRKEISVGRIDKEYDVVLSGGHHIIEINFISGKVLCEINDLPKKLLGYMPHFVDYHNIYYTSMGSFGKINKNSGVIEWEFDLKDEIGETRNISDWMLLGNSNLVLQAMPNHPNGEITCIFDPMKNLKYANIINGVKQ